MFSIPSSRHILVPLVCLTAFIVFLRLFATSWMRNHIDLDTAMMSQFQHGTPIQAQHIQPIHRTNLSDIFDIHTKPVPNNHIAPLLQCSFEPNRITGAVRLPNPILGISLTPPDAPHDPAKRYFNPALIPLPPHSPYPYLLLSRLVTEGLHQESLVCFATLCRQSPSPQSSNRRRDNGNNNDTTTNTHTHHALSPDTRPCNPNDTHHLNPHGGLRCATPPERLNIPPTPALRCDGPWAAFPDIPGFHDPRVFWSGKGEPLVIVNSASGYGCVGLWVVDLRVVFGGLRDLMGEGRMSYPGLTEVTRNPRGDRGLVEKNWVLFFPVGEEGWVLYDLVGRGGTEKEGEHGFDHESVGIEVNGSVDHDHGRGSGSLGTSREGEQDYNNSTARSQHARRSEKAGEKQKPVLRPSRTLAKLIGAGYTTPNLTSPNEAPCLTSDDLLDSRGEVGHWHQGSNSLRLILCTRQDLACLASHSERDLVDQGKVVHFSILHRKFSNALDLPMRYERYVMVWEARFPFRMVGMSWYPILFAGERARPWSDTENGLGDGDVEAKRWEGVYFTYTPSLAWSWRKESVMDENDEMGMGRGTGYLGDEVVVGIGMDDVAQGVVKVRVEELLSCIRLCPDFEKRDTE